LPRATPVSERGYLQPANGSPDRGQFWHAIAAELEGSEGRSVSSGKFALFAELRW
jgi:hypothetical protein